MDVAKIEELLRSLMTGEHSHLHLTMNDENAANYQSVRTAVEEMEESGMLDAGDWVSEDSRRRALETNRIWTLQWYPRTPIGFHRLHAATLVELLEHLAQHASEYQ